MIWFLSSDYLGIGLLKSRQVVPQTLPGFHMACEDLGVKRKFVVYTGEEIFPTNNETTILSLAHFIDELRKQTG